MYMYMCIYIYIYIYIITFPASYSSCTIRRVSEGLTYIYIYTYTCVYIYIYIYTCVTKIMDFRGFDSRIILIVRGGILRSVEDFPEMLSQRTLVGTILVRRLAVVSGHREIEACSIESVRGII